MNEAIFEVETITPLFMAGADQTSAELRAPSFRGLMRYWYRAMLGGIIGTEVSDQETVLQRENSVFGTTDIGSEVQIRISDISAEIDVPRKSGTGSDYLFWSVKHSKRPYFLPETQFRVVLSVRGTQGEKQTTLQQAESAFWLLTHLGGIGSRSRRCGGNLTVTSVAGATSGLPFCQPITPEGFQAQLEQGIVKIRALYGKKESVKEHKARYDILAPGTCRIWVLLNNVSPWEDAPQAVADIGEKLQQYRRTIPSLQNRKIFGIPVMNLTYDEKGKRKSKPIRIERGTGSNVDRVASPLHLRLSALDTSQGKGYVGVATLFKTKWADMSDAEYQLYGLIENWIAKDFPQAIEVQL